MTEREHKLKGSQKREADTQLMSVKDEFPSCGTVSDKGCD